MTLRLDATRMIHYARQLKGRLLAARLGFFLEHMPYTSPSDLLLLDRQRPRSPAYFDHARRDEQMVFMSRWNLMVPMELWMRLRDGTPVKRRWW